MTSERKIRWALVGLGDIVRKRVGAAILQQPQSVLRACVTRNRAARADDLATLQPEHVYGSLKHMLSDPEVDAVYLATPVFLHAEQAIAVLQAGKHVIVEKPMALNAHDAKAMIAAADQARRQLAVAYYRRFWPTFEHVKTLLACGDLGQIVSVHAAMHSWYAPAADDPKAWRVQPDQSGGGVMSDVGSHRLDLLAWWFGLPVRVAADLGTRTHDYQVEDSVTALLMFSGDIPCTVSFQWNSKAWSDELRVVGSEASVFLPTVDGEEIVVSRGRETTRSQFARSSNAHYPLIDDFVQNIMEDRSPRFSGVDGMAATLIMDQIKQSARSHAWAEVA